MTRPYASTLRAVTGTTSAVASSHVMNACWTGSMKPFG